MECRREQRWRHLWRIPRPTVWLCDLCITAWRIVWADTRQLVWHESRVTSSEPFPYPHPKSFAVQLGKWDTVPVAQDFNSWKCSTKKQQCHPDCSRGLSLEGSVICIEPSYLIGGFLELWWLLVWLLGWLLVWLSLYLRSLLEIYHCWFKESLSSSAPHLPHETFMVWR